MLRTPTVTTITVTATPEWAFMVIWTFKRKVIRTWMGIGLISVLVSHIPTHI